MVMIRWCKEEDFEQVLKLLAQLWPEKKLNEKELRKVFLRGLNSDFQSYVCALIEDDIVGFCSLTIKDSLWQTGLLGHIDELVVDKEYRGKGIGSKLMEYITNIAGEKGCVIIELDSALNRNQAHRFYKQNGFKDRAFLFSKKI